MRELEQRRHPMYILSLRLFTIAILLIAFALVHGVWSIYHKEQETWSGRMEAERQLATMKQREIALHSDIVRLQSADGMEAALREQFDMVKEGEGVIVVVDRDKTSPQQGAVNTGTTNMWKRMVPSMILHLFGQ
ncbi:septum formation initiator family protein [Candidatus Kaiserbacteria bacterium]|nr:septum formation initiator family protein [Candidatus Kaiserbacteria bacterium]